ncbi:hypothetical protein BCR34DRAFT_554015 [Clohesyomyces aquaticus]|uniref:Uncharacterized protein n=1 Tax=Clohesyomyces aquaticus TaxID=1231657 RepID=A0A1Y2A743_9PLEO|nr:hypothetical protein BCR34DRAFT_554015 [Clohesyomyces aquaticus]
MATWKVLPVLSEKKIERTPFVKSRKFFAVDDSGSTAGSISRREREFVEKFRENDPNIGDMISLWGSACDVPVRDFNKVNWKSNHGGTYPTQILKHIGTLEAIRMSDVWFLVTDGEVYDGDVHNLATMAHELDILKVPIVFMIAGSRGRTPDTTNISVGISFFASSQDALILFKETQTGKLYVIAAKGCFAALGGSAAAQDLASWQDIPVFTGNGSGEEAFFKHCEKLDIQVLCAKSREGLPSGVSLGPEWETAQGTHLVDLDVLPQAGFLSDDDALTLFAEDAFNNLAVAYKTRKRIPELRMFVQGQKVEQVAPKLEDVSGAAAIISQMADPTTADERKELQGRLREAHAKNRAQYQSVIADFAGSPKEKAARKRNQLVDAALRSLASIETASFSADILSRKSNRARRAEAVTTDTSIAMANLDLEGPAFKGYCLVCCGEDEVMSICLKELGSSDAGCNTTDFALNFPLAAGQNDKNINLVSSQNICFQCALLGPSGQSIYKENIKAIIPAVQYDGNNKKYINDQLYLSLTSGLQTGAAGVAQLFMAILHQVLDTKSWAGAGLKDSQVAAGEHSEEYQRKKTFQWMLDQLVQHTQTRKTFSEVGDWCSFPEALSWVAEDYQNNGLASFVVTYPIPGCDLLGALGKERGIFPPDMMSQLRSSLSIYQMASKYLSDLRSATYGQDDWKQNYLDLIYREFNSDSIPKDLSGAEALMFDVEAFKTCMRDQLSMQPFPQGRTLLDDVKEMQKLQLMLFWLIYSQKSHCTAQTFFSKIRHNEHLASAVFDPTLSVPEPELHDTLRSIFVKPAGEFINVEAAAVHNAAVIPFTNPFGASVIRCGVAACGKSFIPEHVDRDIDAALASVKQIHDNRAKHLIEVFGIRGRFEKACTGLPEVTAVGSPPSSSHINLHIAVAKTWAELPAEKRRAVVVVDEEGEREDFVAAVRKRICKQRRGDIFRGQIDDDIKAVLPSFFKVLGEASKVEGGTEGDMTLFEHEFKENKLDWKIRYELEALGW